MIKIASAGNSDTAAFATLVAMGYSVRIEKNSDEKTGRFVANKAGSEFIGDTPLETLGLIAMFEVRGANWKPTAGEADALAELERAVFGADEGNS